MTTTDSSPNNCWPIFNYCNYISMQIAAAEMYELGFITAIEMLILQSIAQGDSESDFGSPSGFDLLDSVDTRINYIDAVRKIRIKAASSTIHDPNYLAICDYLIQLLKMLSGRNINLTTRIIPLRANRKVRQ